MVTTIRLYYEAAVAVALTFVVALSLCGLVAAVVTGAGSPNLFIATIAFLLIGGFMFFRIRRITQ